jgi:hypothetical protein
LTEGGFEERTLLKAFKTIFSTGQQRVFKSATKTPFKIPATNLNKFHLGYLSAGPGFAGRLGSVLADLALGNHCGRVGFPAEGGIMAASSMSCEGPAPRRESSK